MLNEMINLFLKKVNDLKKKDILIQKADENLKKKIKVVVLFIYFVMDFDILIDVG